MSQNLLIKIHNFIKSERSSFASNLKLTLRGEKRGFLFSKMMKKLGMESEERGKQDFCLKGKFKKEIIKGFK